jgi:hypothetical protein
MRDRNHGRSGEPPADREGKVDVHGVGSLMVEKRGRKSLGDLSLVTMDPNMGRPEPPPDVIGREAEIWRSTVNSMPRNWFGPETWPLLKGFCKHSFAAEKLGERYTELLSLGPPPVGELSVVYWNTIDHVADLYARETRSIGNMASKLRLAKIQRQSGHKDEVEIRNTPKRRMWDE